MFRLFLLTVSLAVIGFGMMYLSCTYKGIDSDTRDILHIIGGGSLFLGAIGVIILMVMFCIGA